MTIGAERLPARTVFWAAGVQAERLAMTPAARNRSRVAHQSEQRLLGSGIFERFVVGDMASLEMAPGQLVPGVAPAAIQAGEHAARMILRDLEGEPRQPFVYNDKGTLATIGKSRAVGQIGRLKLTGRIAWFCVAADSRVPADRISQPAGGALQLGVELHVLEARGEADHRERMETKELRPDWQMGDWQIRDYSKCSVLALATRQSAKSANPC